MTWARFAWSEEAWSAEQAAAEEATFQPDEDFFLPPLGFALALPLIFSAPVIGPQVPWAGSYDEKVIGFVQEEDAWIPPVLVDNRTLGIIQASSGGSEVPPAIVDEDYPWKKPIQWAPQVIRLSWGGDEEIMILKTEESEWIPSVNKVRTQSKLIEWQQGEETFLTPLVEEEPWLRLNSLKSPWISNVITDQNSDFVPQAVIAAEEDFWLPLVSYYNTPSISLLVGTASRFEAVVTPIVEEDAKLLLGKYVIGWSPRLVSDSTDDIVPQPGLTFEEDYWCSPKPIDDTKLSLIVGTAAKVEAETLIGPPEDTEWKAPTFIKSGLRSPVIITDPFDDKIVQNIAIEEEPYVSGQVPICTTQIIAPWSCGNDDLVLVIGGDEFETWVGLLINKPLKHTKAINAWRVGENEPFVTAFHIDDEAFKPIQVSSIKLIGQQVWLLESDDIASEAAAIIDEEFYYNVTITPAKLVRYDSWRNEQNEFTIFVPVPPEVPPICATDAPSAISITRESPFAIVKEFKGPTGINVTRDTPLATNITKETLGDSEIASDKPIDPCA